jgi:protein TonB
MMAASSPLEIAFALPSRGPAPRGLFVALAVVVHGAVALGIEPTPDDTRKEETKLTELEIAPPPPPEPEPKEIEPPAPEAPAAPIPAARPASAPAAARAGSLVTAKSDAPTKEAPVDFVTDPNGTSYGSGVVARGGTSDHGEGGGVAGARKGPPVAGTPAPQGAGIVPAENLSRRPTLNEANACRGFYPREASVDQGRVTIKVVVRPRGEVASISVLSESPVGEGFGRAARACLQRKRFEPGLDKEGAPVLSATTFQVRFER